MSQDTNNQSVGQQDDEVVITPEESQETPMPSVEQEDSTENSSEVEEELPESISERTRLEFEKLKESNRRLKEQLEERGKQSAYGQSVYDGVYGQSPQPEPVVQGSNYPGMSQQELAQTAVNFTDENGYLDVQAFEGFLKRIDERASKAEAVALKAQRDAEARQVAEAHLKYPWLDPKNPKFDPNGFELVRDRLVRNMADGRQMPLTDVAESILKVYKPASASTEDQKQAKAQVSTVGGQTQKRSDEGRLDDLRTRTRQGDMTALRERIKRSGY